VCEELIKYRRRWVRIIKNIIKFKHLGKKKKIKKNVKQKREKGEIVSVECKKSGCEAPF